MTKLILLLTICLVTNPSDSESVTPSTTTTTIAPGDHQLIVHNEHAITATSLEESQSETTLKKIQYSILICIGTIGIVGNSGIMICTIGCRSLRKSSNAFMFHHCVLDLLKSLYCCVFANSIYNNQAPRFCNLLGGSFIVCVTSTAFNILAMVMNEAYVFADLNAGVRDSGNYCCVVFSISTIWFASIILNLGVAFLPGNPSFIKDVGHCTFVYGVTRNYVLHILWIILVTLAVGLTSMYLKKLYADICNNQYSRLTKVVRASITIDPAQMADMPVDDMVERSILKKVERYSFRKFYTLLLLICLFIVHWYPMFMLTIIDHKFHAPPGAYKVLTIFACSNAAVNPFIFVCLIKRRCCCHYELPTLPLAPGDRQVNTKPRGRVQDDILHSSTRYSRYLASDDTASGIYNEFYQRADGDNLDISSDGRGVLWPSHTSPITSSL